MDGLVLEIVLFKLGFECESSSEAVDIQLAAGRKLLVGGVAV